jgi:hypothetical protein
MTVTSIRSAPQIQVFAFGFLIVKLVFRVGGAQDLRTGFLCPQIHGHEPKYWKRVLNEFVWMLSDCMEKDGCPIRVGRGVLLVMRFGQPVHVGLITFLCVAVSATDPITGAGAIRLFFLQA